MSYIYRHKEQLKRSINSVHHIGGKEYFATVIKSGFKNKTVTAKVYFRLYISKFKRWQTRTAKLQVHDPFNICRVGDKVHIRSCDKLSATKYYYARNFFIMSPRMNFVVSKFLHYEKEALVYNDDLVKSNILSFKSI